MKKLYLLLALTCAVPTATITAKEQIKKEDKESIHFQPLLLIPFLPIVITVIASGEKSSLVPLIPVAIVLLFSSDFIGKNTVNNNDDKPKKKL